MSWDAGAIVGSIRLNVAEYDHGLNMAEQSAELFPAIVTEFLENPLLGFAEVAKEAMHSAFEAFEGTAARFHQIGLASENLGVSAEFISSLGAVAKAKSVDIDSLGMSLKFLQQRAADALSGEQGAAKGFADIGVSITELQGLLKDPEQMFYRVAQGISSIENPALRVQAASDLMSRAGFKMVSLFAEGPDKIKSLQKEMEALGGGVTKEQAEMGEKWGEVEAKFDAAWNGIKAEIGQAILGESIQGADQWSAVLKDVRGIVHEIAEVIPPIFALVRSGLDHIDAWFHSSLIGRLLSIPALLGDVATLGAFDLSGQVLAAGGGGGGSSYQPVQVTASVNVHEAGAEAAAREAGRKADGAVRLATLRGYQQAAAAASGKVSSSIGGKTPKHYRAGM